MSPTAHLPLTLRRWMAPLVRRIRPKPSACLYPAFRDPDEFLDAYWKARYFVPPESVRRIALPIAFEAEWLRSGAEPPRPGYVAEMPLPAPRHVRVWRADDAAARGAAARCRHVFVWDSTRAEEIAAEGAPADRILDVDRHRARMEGWAWAGFLNQRLPWSSVERRTRAAGAALRAHARACGSFRRCYVFGTGPSIEQAIERDFSDGYRIVCNTIVRNRALLDHIRPHFIVAGDAVFHFGNNRHAYAFRCDLAAALATRPMLFVTRDLFHPLFQRYHPAAAARAVAAESAPEGIHFDMLDRPVYHQMGNILNCLMLPLATALADEVCFLGFDGRAPGEPLFWKNSDANAYNELKPSIMAAHPAFFSTTDYVSYAGEHGDKAEAIMAAGEALGKKYICLNRSYIPAFQKRQGQA